MDTSFFLVLKYPATLTTRQKETGKAKNNLAKDCNDRVDGDGSNLGRGTTCCTGQVQMEKDRRGLMSHRGRRGLTN